MKVLKQGAALLILAAFLLSSSGPAALADETKIQPQGKSYFTYFDTVSYVYSYAGDSADKFNELSAEVSAILAGYHQLFDIYHEYTGITNLCTLNRCAGGEPLKADPKLIDFLLYAKELCEMTGGEMNVMLGAVTRLWHECRESASSDRKNASIPSQEELEAAAEHTGIDLLEIDAENGTIRIRDPLASIDVGAIGKGFATECAADYLESQKAQGYVLNVGGNIRIIGTRPDGTGWVTGVRDPRDPDTKFAVRLRIADTACVSSGVYERYFTVNGTRYHHIVDPDTLYPALYYDALTVLTRDSGLADALSTALFCMPFEESLALAEELEGVEVLWIFPDGEIRTTSGMDKYIIHE